MTIISHNEALLFLGINLAMAACLLIDTSVWWVRSFAGTGEVGRYVARTNIYSYSGRLFAFTYMTLLSLMVDNKAAPKDLARTIAISYVVGAVLHVLVLNKSSISEKALYALARLLGLSPPSRRPVAKPLAKGSEIRLTTAVASFLLAAAMGAPYLLASFHPELRLTISNIGQIINSMAMIFILFYVDQSMYQAWDREDLPSSIIYYSQGRIIGIGTASLTSALVYVVL